MTDLSAIKARLSDPREVAAMLGLRVLARQARGVITKCPIGGGDDGSLSIRTAGDGTLQAYCFGGCVSGDVLSLFAAIEGDFKRGLARAQELAGGAVGAPVAAWEAPERLGPDVYHELASRILEAGRLDGQPWTRDVGEYLQRRRLLQQAQGDGWCALPSLNWLLQIAKDVCDENRDNVRAPCSELVASGHGAGLGLRTSAEPSRRLQREPKESGHVTPCELLIKAKLAQWNRHGEFVPYFGRWSLVIPWRGPDGRINALQRRRTWEFVPRDDNDPEPPKYVLPWAPEWPYGSERLGENDRLSVGDNGSDCVRLRQAGARSRHVAIVEGAIDTLALRSLYPRMQVVGIPGIGGWRTSWASLFQGRTVRYALDRGKLNKRGIIEEDRAAARIALCIAGRHEEDPTAEACSLCGGKEAWLCGFCGRRRSTAKDWAEQWANRTR